MNKCWVVQREVVTNAGEHLTCHSRNGNHRILHSHQDGILHNLHIRSWARPQPHACHSIPCRDLHSRSYGIHQDRIHHIQSRAQQQPWAQPQPHACHSIPCRVLHSRSCGIHKTVSTISEVGLSSSLGLGLSLTLAIVSPVETSIAVAAVSTKTVSTISEVGLSSSLGLGLSLT